MEEDSFFSSYNGNQCSPKLFGYQKSSRYIFLCSAEDHTGLERNKDECT